MINDDTSTLFETDPNAPPAMALRQGVVEAWDSDTGENSIQVAGGTLVNIPALTGESVALVAGDVVALLTTGDRWLVLGKVTTPGDPGTVPTWVGDITALVPLTELAAVTDGLTITGATNETAAPAAGARVVINDPAYPGRIVLYSDVAEEVTPAQIWPNVVGSGGTLVMRSPDLGVAGTDHADIRLTGNPGGEPNYSVAEIAAALVFLNGFRIDILTHSVGSDPVRIGSTADHIEVLDNALSNADLTDPSNVFPGQLLTQVLTDACSTNVSLTTTEVDITGASITFSTTKANAKYVCNASFYFAATAANNNVAFGKLNIDGTNEATFAHFTGSNTVPDRVNSAQTWAGTLASAGEHTFKLRGVHANANNVVTVNASHTTIVVQIFE